MESREFGVPVVQIPVQLVQQRIWLLFARLGRHFRMRFENPLSRRSEPRSWSYPVQRLEAFFDFLFFSEAESSSTTLTSSIPVLRQSVNPLSSFVDIRRAAMQLRYR